MDASFVLIEKREKTKVFLLTFFSYVFISAVRKAFSTLKADLIEQRWFGPTVKENKLVQGTIDTTFLFCYAFGLFFSGIIGDRYNLRYVIAIGMAMSGVISILLGILGYFTHSATLFVILWGLNGIVQSSGWPANVAVMGNWFGHTSRGFVMGVWCANASIGNIIGTYICVLVLKLASEENGWKLSMIVVGSTAIIHAIIVFGTLYHHPSQIGLPDPNEKHEEETRLLPVNTENYGYDPKSPPRVPKPISFWEAWLIPGVIAYSLSHACLKMVNYALFFWLPLYIAEEFSTSSTLADSVSSIFDVGQILGGIIAGKISDIMGVRSPVVVLFLLLAGACLYFFEFASLTLVSVLIFFAGLFMGGPANLISGTIAADLGTHESIKGRADALATVTGIIDGSGSIGAAVGQYIVAYLSAKYDSWPLVFTILVILNVLAALCLASLVLNDVKLMQQKKQESEILSSEPLLSNRRHADI